MSNLNKPRVSIGLPVYNGEKYLEAELNSLLAQTYSDFEVIISDNASTDRTQQICLEYVAKDSRVRYYRNERNLGAPRNYNRTIVLSRGEFFKWAAADDVHLPDYLKKCVDVLDRDPSVVLCHSRIGCINEEGTLVSFYDLKMRIDSRKRNERFADLISLRYNLCWPIFGLMRKDILKLTPGHGDYRGADANLLAEMSLYGRFYEIPEYLFLRRDHSEAYTKKFVSGPKSKSALNSQMAWWASDSWINFTTLKNFLEFFNSVDRAPLKWCEKMSCYGEIIKWFLREGWRLTGNDIENYILSRSSIGRNMVVVVKRLLRRTFVPVIEKRDRSRFTKRNVDSTPEKERSY